MNVNVWGPTLTKERTEKHQIGYLTLEDLLKDSDIISLHVRLVKATTELLTKEDIKLMKKDSILINTSRGKVINQDDLIWALQNRVIGGAGLDVFDKEPIEPENPLLKMKNVVLTPHIG